MIPRTACRASGDGVLLSTRVQPGASRSRVLGGYGEDAVRIALHSPPVDGRANAELCVFVAELCKLPKSAVTLKSGAASRSKLLQINGIGILELLNILDGNCQK